MTRIVNKFRKYIAILLVIALFIPIFLIAQNKLQIEKLTVEITQEDKQIASNISNITGVKTEEILRQRENGKSWNEIMSQLVDKEATQNTEDNDFLEHIGLTKEHINTLEEEFTNEEIIEAKLLVERVMYQLQYITSSQSEQNIQPIINTEDSNEEEIRDYAEIEQKIDINTATYLILKLKEDLGSMNAVFNEYLLALQLEISLEEYITDKELYQKHKREKSYEIELNKIITIEKIEQKMLKLIQAENQKNNKLNIENNIVESQHTISQELQNSLPELPNPNADIKQYKPEIPAEKIQKEIKEINPNENIY